MGAREQAVHIILLGHEIDRAISPFEKVNADTVYLLSNIGEITPIWRKEQNYSTHEGITRLKARDMSVECVKTVLFDLLDIICNTGIII